MELLEKLGIGITQLIFYPINLLILIVGLYLLLFRPVRKIIKSHKEKMDGVIEENRKLNEEANGMKHHYEQMIEESKQETIRLSASMAEKAQIKSEEIIGQAKEQANNIVLTAKKEVIAEKERLKGDLKDTAAKLAVDIAQKVLEREISVADNEKVIDECLASWENDR